MNCLGMSCPILLPEVFHAKEGLKEFVRYVDRHRTSIIGDPICLKTEKDGVPIEIALLYNNDYSENIHSYVNNINTIEGGTQLTGEGITDDMKTCLSSARAKGVRIDSGVNREKGTPF